MPLDFTLRIPESYGQPLNPAMGMHGGANRGMNPISSAISTIQNGSTSSPSTLSGKNVGFGGYLSSICERLSQIWNRIYWAFADFFSDVYRLITGTPLLRSYPQINENLSRDALLKLYWGLGMQNKWRECIDGRYHHLNDKFCFDRGAHGGTVEPGFISSMEETFTFVQNYVNLKVDANWYLHLHRHTAAHFRGDENGTLMGQERVGVFRDADDNISAGFSGYYQPTQEALNEFNALNQELKREFGDSFGLGDFIYTDASRTGMSLKYKPMSRAQITRIFNKFLVEYYGEIERATNPDQKLLAIAKLQQRLEWLHPVRDGTARTSTAFMNKNLTENGFHPAILEYPHVSSSYGLAQWKDYLQSGLVRWERERARLNPSAVV